MSSDEHPVREPLIADPFTAFLDIHRRALPASRGPKRFNSGEHIWLGGHGAAAACEAFAQTRGVHLEGERLFTEIRRKHGREQLHYGELVALSGDFYESPEALFEEKPSRLPWLWEGNDLSDLRQLFAEELRWIEDSDRGKASTAYPVENLRMAWNAKAYVELALQNTDHFGWHNMRAYCRYHAQALQLAADARGREDETFRRALYTNAFADHFLTDGFAAGHIRVPRAEIRQWASKRGLSEKIAGALSKLLHDQDGHVDVHSLHGVMDERDRPSEDGLYVQDATGTAWHTRCDGQLFLDAGAQSSVAVERAVAAVAASVGELLSAWQLGELPRGVYEATRFVPFPHASAPSLADKFSAQMGEPELERLWKSVLWYSKIPWISGLHREHMRDLFAALPELMAALRAHVAADLSADSTLRARLDPGYVAAYERIA